MSVDHISWAMDQDVPPTGRYVLVVLANYANHAGECWPSYETIAAKTGLNRRSIIRWIEKLESAGIVSKKKRRDDANRQETNIYVLAMDRRAETRRARPGDTESPGNSSGNGVTQSHPGIQAETG